MLHPYQEASRTKIPRIKTTSERIPGQELLGMLSEIGVWLEGATPSIRSAPPQEANTVSVFYRNVAYTPESLWDLCGQTMARLNKYWPIAVFGTAENREMVRLTAEAEGDAIHLIQQSLSGKSTSVMQSLCMQIDCPDPQTADRLIRLLASTNWETNIAAMNHWQDAAFLQEQGLLIETDPQGRFCYASVRPNVTTREMLFSLNFGQKRILWAAFLKDGFDPAEFTWLSDEISKDTLEQRLEWELSLWETMDCLRFRMINKEKSFELYDGTGKRLYFGADGGCAAERVFLKILFPLND